MWIKKRADEVKSDRSAARRWNYLAGIDVPLLVYVGVSSRAGLGLLAPVRIPVALVLGFILLAWFQRKRWNRTRSTVHICDECNAVKSSDGKSDCACGGKFYPLAAMKWIDSPTYQTARPSSDHPSLVSSALL